jgi:hypothetical protein
MFVGNRECQGEQSPLRKNLKLVWEGEYISGGGEGFGSEYWGSGYVSNRYSR